MEGIMRIITLGTKEKNIKYDFRETCFGLYVKNNKIFKGSITLTFAQHGSSGTDYTFSFGLGELIEMPEGNLSSNISFSQ